MSANAARRYAVSGTPISRTVGEEIFVMTADSRLHWMRNSTASFLWEAIVEAGKGGVAVEALAGRLSAEFDVSQAQAIMDVSEFMTELERAGVVGSGEGT